MYVIGTVCIGIIHITFPLIAKAKGKPVMLEWLTNLLANTGTRSGTVFHIGAGAGNQLRRYSTATLNYCKL